MRAERTAFLEALLVRTEFNLRETTKQIHGIRFGRFANDRLETLPALETVDQLIAAAAATVKDPASPPVLAAACGAPVPAVLPPHILPAVAQILEEAQAAPELANAAAPPSSVALSAAAPAVPSGAVGLRLQISTRAPPSTPQAPAKQPRTEPPAVVSPSLVPAFSSGAPVPSTLSLAPPVPGQRGRRKLVRVPTDPSQPSSQLVQDAATLSATVELQSPESTTAQMPPPAVAQQPEPVQDIKTEAGNAAPSTTAVETPILAAGVSALPAAPVSAPPPPSVAAPTNPAGETAPPNDPVQQQSADAEAPPTPVSAVPQTAAAPVPGSAISKRTPKYISRPPATPNSHPLRAYAIAAQPSSTAAALPPPSPAPAPAPIVAPASVGRLKLTPEAEHARQLHIRLFRVWRALAAHRYAAAFRQPVTEEEAPGYFKRVKNPMDLSTMRKKLDSGGYPTAKSFKDDAHLMYQNCMTYNDKESDLHKISVDMKKLLDREMADVLAWDAADTQRLAESGVSVPEDLDMSPRPGSRSPAGVKRESVTQEEESNARNTRHRASVPVEPAQTPLVGTKRKRMSSDPDDLDPTPTRSSSADSPPALRLRAIKKS
eukprot:TRINITY_DN1685_c0_g1_i2.p1 TRINITY_DN1685_c0_g1~~TRINITY_DN1685_c0_g1_i2.p1  ORF type:complete len:690 (+),score=152.12 TRINITY_DN1685_c0_g1_i2:265-2070(+)